MKRLFVVSFKYTGIGWITGLSFGLAETILILFQYRDSLLPAWRLGRTTLFALRAVLVGDPKLIMVPLSLDKYHMPQLFDRLGLLVYMTSLYAVVGALCGLLLSFPMFLWFRIRKNESLVSARFIASGMTLVGALMALLIWLKFWIFPKHGETSLPFLIVDCAVILGVSLLGILNYRFAIPRLANMKPRNSSGVPGKRVTIVLSVVSATILTIVGLRLPIHLMTAAPESNSVAEVGTGLGTGVVPETLPNIVFISIDTLRPDHLGCYGYERSTSPNIDRLASQGIVFTNAYSQSPWTLPSHMTMFTSLYSHVHGLYDDGRVLSPAIPTLPELLRKEGYATYGVVSATYVAARFGFSRGFDVFIEDFGKRAEKITARAVSFLADRENTDDPFFLFVHYFDPHSTYSAPDPFKTMFDSDYSGPVNGSTETLVNINFFGKEISKEDLEHIIALYDGEIAYCDAQIGVLLSELERLGLSDNTVFILTSDHGEEFLDHGLMYHRHTLYDELLRVPFIVSFDKILPGGKTVASTVRHVDILPTIMDLLDVELGIFVQGETLLPINKRGRVWGRTPLLRRGYFWPSGQGIAVSPRYQDHPKRRSRALDRDVSDSSRSRGARRVFGDPAGVVGVHEVSVLRLCRRLSNQLCEEWFPTFSQRRRIARKAQGSGLRQLDVESRTNNYQRPLTVSLLRVPPDAATPALPVSG